MTTISASPSTTVLSTAWMPLDGLIQQWGEFGVEQASTAPAQHAVGVVFCALARETTARSYYTAAWHAAEKGDLTALEHALEELLSARQYWTDAMLSLELLLLDTHEELAFGERLRNGERWNFNRAKESLRASKQYDSELRFVYGKLLAEVYFRLDKAMQGFFRRVAAGEKPGFPRVKPRHQFFTLCYPAMYLEVQGKTIILPTGGGGNWGPKRYSNIIAHLTETPPEHFREVAVSRDARGNYYCSFVHDDLEQGEVGYEHKTRPIIDGGIVAFDLGIKTLATGVNDQEHFYHIGGFKGYRWYNKQLDKIRSKRDRCRKKSRRYIHLSKVYKRVSERKRNKQRDCLHKASHLIAGKLAERAVVIGDLSQGQMVIKKKENETPKERNKRRIRNRMVYNDWGLYSFVQMLEYKCLRFGKELSIISERDTSKMCHVCKHKQDMPLWKRTYRCANCGLVMDRDENSAVNILKRFVARLGPHR